jgi:SAM-dependent methyltransferase
MDAADWDARYATDELVWKAEPNRFLEPMIEGLLPGRALDLACGEGRNAVWLATQGWEVTGVDFSQTGLDKAARLAGDRGVGATWVCADVVTWEPPHEFDLVVVFYLQIPPAARRGVLATAARAVAPGGTLLWLAHDRRNLRDGIGGPKDEAVLADAGDLRADLDAAGVVGLVADRAGELFRPVEVDGTEHLAIECVLRARRAG